MVVLGHADQPRLQAIRSTFLLSPQLDKMITMRKALLQFLVLAVVFLGTWQLLSRIDFMGHFHIAKMDKKLEKKLGDRLLKEIKENNVEIGTDEVKNVFDSIKDRICYANAIDPNDVDIYLIRSNEVNAFAMPGNHIVVYTGLIQYCDSASELSGILAHEISHIELNHIMKGLVSQVGIGVLAAIATNGNSAAMTRIVRVLSSSAYERKQEREADANGVIYLEHAQINPEGFANVMEKLAKLQSDVPEEMTWISSHPESKERAENIRKLAADHDTTFLPVVTDAQWQSFKAAAER